MSKNGLTVEEAHYTVNQTRNEKDKAWEYMSLDVRNLMNAAQTLQEELFEKDKRIAELEARRKWHKPEDLLPVEETYVVAIVEPEEDRLVVLRYETDGWWVAQDGTRIGQEDYESVLFWCELPSPRES